MNQQPTYLDYNATAPVLPAVLDAMREVEALPLNPSSVHALGRKAKQLVEESRRTIASAMGVWPDEVIFTASGTEANNMALHALADYQLICPAAEHSSVLNVVKAQGGAVLPVQPNGLVDMAALEAELSQKGEKTLVSVMLANNETGVIQPVKEIAQLVHKHGALLHCDAVQALGKHAFDFNTIGADMMTIAAHKVGGPVGVGALLVRNDVHVQPLLRGGGQEKGRRAGTENVKAILGFGTLMAHLPDLSAHTVWREEVIREIQAVSPASRIAGQGADCLSNTLNITMPGVSSETQLMNFDLAGICVSAGSACSSGRIEPSHVLLAMGYSADEANSALRLSMGWTTTQADVQKFITQWQSIYQRLCCKEAA